MGIFSRNYNRPGPGIPKDMPRKKGLARVGELLLRDFADIVKLSILFSIVCLPSFALFIFAIFPFLFGEFEFNLIFLILSIIFAFPVGGGVTACCFNITRLMRDDPSFVWYDFKRKFKENYKQAAVTGIVCTAFIYMQIMLWFQMYFQMVAGVFTGGILWIILILLSYILFNMITPYIFMHYSYVNLGTLQIVKNSLLMSFAFLPRSFMGAVTGNFMWILYALYIPNSLAILPVVPFFLVGLSMLLSLSWTWPPFDKFHGIEEKLIQLKNEKDALENEASSSVFKDTDES